MWSTHVALSLCLNIIWPHAIKLLIQSLKKRQCVQTNEQMKTLQVENIIACRNQQVGDYLYNFSNIDMAKVGTNHIQNYFTYVQCNK